MTAGPTRARRDHGDGRARDRTRAPVPEPLRMPVVDSNCHLDVADGPDGEWLGVDDALAAAAAVGVTRIV